MRRKSRIFLFVLIVASLAGVWGCSQRVEKTAVEPYEAEIKFTEQQQAFLLDAARKGLAGESIPDFAEDLKAVEGAGAVIEVFLPPSKPVIAVVGAKPFADAFAAAVKKAVSDSNFDRIKPDLAKARIKLGVIDKVTDLGVGKNAKPEGVYKKIAKKSEDALTGFILVTPAGQAYYQIPELVLYNGWGIEGDTKRFMGHKLVTRQIKALAKEAGLSDKEWMNGELYGFTTVTFIDDAKTPGKPVMCYRAKTVLPPLDAASLKAAAIANADYLAAAVDAKGKFNYIYYPEKDAYESTYGIVRHAGAAYGLFEAYNFFKDVKYLDAGRRAMDFLLERAKVPTEVPGIAIIEEKGSSVLGTNALAAMAFASMPENKMTDKDKDFRAKFGESILYYRMPEKGLFYTSFSEALNKKAPKQQARYFPGEAMLSLVRLYERTQDKKWLNAAKDLAPGQKELWEKAGVNEVGNYCWVGQAFARMARIETDPKLKEEYKQAAYSHAEAVLKHQYSKSSAKYPDYVGGADNSRPPRTTPTSARGESLAENYLLAKFLGDVETQKKFGVALLQAIHFCTANQWSEQNSWFLPIPEKARGGIRGSLIADDIRIDYNQHLLTTELNALTVPDDLKALGVTEW